MPKVVLKNHRGGDSWLSIGVLGAVALLYIGFLFPNPENIYNKDDAGWFLTLGINLAEYGR